MRDHGSLRISGSPTGIGKSYTVIRFNLSERLWFFRPGFYDILIRNYLYPMFFKVGNSFFWNISTIKIYDYLKITVILGFEKDLYTSFGRKASGNTTVLEDIWNTFGAQCVIKWNHTTIIEHISNIQYRPFFTILWKYPD